MAKAKLQQIKSGYIPDDVTIVYAPKQSVNTRWEGSPDETAFIVERDVFPAFAVPSDKTDRLKTAREWAQHKCHQWVWNEEKGSGKDVALGEPAEVTQKNSPQTLHLCGLEIRDEGGRAYKVVTDEGYYFDLREDVVLELAIQCGIKKGGELGGKYLWAVMGSQMRLVREGSILHQMMKEATTRGTMKKLGSGQLDVGGVYRTKKGDTAIFLGYVMSAKKADQAAKKKLLWVEVASYTTPEEKVKELFSPKNFKLKKKATTKDYAARDDIDGPEGLYHVKITASHSMIEQVGTVQLPEGVITKTHQLCVLGMQARMMYLEEHRKYTERQNKTGSWGRKSPEELQHEHHNSIVDSLNYHYEMSHFYPVDGQPPILKEYQQPVGVS